MKLVTFRRGSDEKIGAVTSDGTILDLQAAHRYVFEKGDPHPALASMLHLIESGAAGLVLAADLCRASPHQASMPADAVELLAPLPRPAQVRDFMCFETHVRQAAFNAQRLGASQGPNAEAAVAEIERIGRQPPPPVWFQQPVYYKANRFAIAGTGSVVHWPAYSKLIDYELEYACIIGKQGRDIGVGDARSHIFGYTIYNDFSARDAQSREMTGRLGPAKGKDFDGGTILGPCIVTADELTDPYALSMVARVNGETWTDENSSSIHWTFEQMIAHVSQSETLYPGEVLGSGTVGNGCGLEHMRFLKDGDVVEITVGGIGTISNRISAPHTRPA